MLVLLVVATLQRMEVPNKGAICGSSQNKLDVYCSLDLAEENLLLLSSGHQGDGRQQRWWLLLFVGTGEQGNKAATMMTLGSLSSVAHPRRLTVIQPLNPLAIGQPLPPWLST
jgi:hypothetical protein